MSKIYRRVVRRDGEFDNHVHALPQGKLTNGQIAKPSQSGMFNVHTHLYEHEGKVHETGPASGDPGHTHETIIGETSGPQKLPAQTNFGPKNDSIERRGRDYVVVNANGVEISRGRSAVEAMQRYDEMEPALDYDEGFAKRAMHDDVGHVNEALWQKAKHASQEAFGSIRWPFVQYLYQQWS